ASTNGASSNEVIYVLTNSIPEALTNGDWYLTVVNRNNDLVPYVVRATEVLDTDIVRLTNCIAYGATVPAAGLPTNNAVNYYVFNVPTNALQVDFETFNANGNVNLYIRKGFPLPEEALYDRLGTNGGILDEFIAISTNVVTLTTNVASVVLTPG